MSGKKDFTIDQGSNFEYEFTFEALNDADAYEPVDLSEAVVDMDIRAYHSATTPLIDLGTEGYIAITEPLNGKIEINIPGSVTNELNFSSAVYDIILTFNPTTPQKTTIRMMEGRVYMSKGVSR